MGDQCCICLRDIYKLLPCGHEIHTGCIDQWKSTGKATCPLCRAEIPLEAEVRDTKEVKALKKRNRKLKEQLEKEENKLLEALRSLNHAHTRLSDAQSALRTALRETSEVTTGFKAALACFCVWVSVLIYIAHK